MSYLILSLDRTYRIEFVQLRRKCSNFLKHSGYKTSFLFPTFDSSNKYFSYSLNDQRNLMLVKEYF